MAAGYCRSYWMITASLMQDNVTLNSAEFLPYHSLSLPRSVSNFWHLWSSVSVKFPEGFGRIREISPIRHLLQGSSAVLSGRRFEHCCCFVPTTGRENSGSSVFWLLLSTAIYNECNGTKRSSLFFEHGSWWNLTIKLMWGGSSRTCVFYSLIYQI